MASIRLFVNDKRPLQYTDETADAVKSEVEAADGVIVRAGKGEHPGTTRDKFYRWLRELAESKDAKCQQVMPHPVAMTELSAKDVVTKLGTFGGGSTCVVYRTAAEMAEHLPASLAATRAGGGVAAGRVLKPSQGTQGEGVVLCQPSGDSSGAGGAEMSPASVNVVELVRANDNGLESVTLPQLLDRFDETVFAQDGYVVDQPFCPRITGEWAGLDCDINA